MSNQVAFPVIRVEGVEVTCYGVSPSGRQALIGRRVPMEERHLFGGTGGGWSKVGLKDDKGRPKMVLKMTLIPFCKVHRVAWLNEAGCPECGETPDHLTPGPSPKGEGGKDVTA